MKRLFWVGKIISVFLCCTSAFGGASDTRAKDLESSSHKPRSNKRVSSEGIAAVSTTPLDLFFDKEQQRRSQIELIWKWDFWCQLQPKVGNCSNSLATYYYDAQLDQCRTFGYSGCDGNNNNFKSLVECERHCKGTTYMPLKETTRTTFCGLQPNAGLCLALTERFYYDVNSAHCKKFVYGGCGGNQNRFTSKEQCESRCLGEDATQ